MKNKIKYGISSIGVENFRSLKKLDPIEIKPITILVGENSCGKSSFLRLLPLLKQSQDEKINGPLALYGEYVDFGSFSNAKNVSSTDDTITMKINGHLQPVFLRRKTTSLVSFSVTYDIKQENKENPYVSYLHVLLGDDYSFSIKISADGDVVELKINGKIFQMKRKLIAGYPDGCPCILPFVVENGYSLHHWYMPNCALDIECEQKSLQKVLTEDFFHQIDISDFQSKDKCRKKIHLLSKKKKVSYEDDVVDEIITHLIYSSIPNILYTINRNMFFALNNVKYAKPIRANTERYYRYKPLHVNEVSSDGNNLSQVLSSFSSKKKLAFEKWMRDNFGFKAYVRGDELKSIYIKIGKSEEHNIIDMGYGFTQMLPIVVQLWLSLQNESNFTGEKDVIFAIEQPELHLHPAYQKLLLNVFCETLKQMKKSNQKIRFLLETHSKSFITALARCIEENKSGIDSDDISILIFENKNGCESVVQQSCFDKDGNLENWPIGFFG
jgi:AAA15 family ATPase/GTPase